MTEEEAKLLDACLVLVEWTDARNGAVKRKRTWLHAHWQDEDGEGPMWDGEDIVWSYKPDGWVEDSTDELIDETFGGSIVAFAPLPEVEL